MDGKHIPGFYYDHDKKKYFRVLPNHVVPQGAKYSKEQVSKERKERRKRKRSEALDRLRHSQLLHRSPFPQPLHRQEITGHLEVSEVWPRGLREHGIANFEDEGWQLRYFVPGRQCSTPCWFVGGTPRGMPPIHNLRIVRNNRVRDLAHYDCAISSVEVTKQGQLVVTTQGDASQQPTIQMITPDLDVSTLIRPPSSMTNTVWCCAPNPLAAMDEVAVGCGGNVFRLVADESEWTQAELPSMPLEDGSARTPPDFLSLAWLDGNVLAAGRRDGKILLYDTRSQDYSERFQHAGAVFGLKRGFCGSQLIACGTKSALELYDTRFLPRKTAVQHKRPVHSVLQFEGYRNDFDHTLGFDACPELDIVAAGDQAGALRLYSMRTGRLVRTWTSPGSNLLNKPSGSVKCLRFLEDEGGWDLVASRGGALIRYGWA